MDEEQYDEEAIVLESSMQEVAEISEELFFESPEISDTEATNSLSFSQAEKLIDPIVMKVLADKFNGSLDRIRSISEEDQLF